MFIQGVDAVLVIAPVPSGRAIVPREVVNNLASIGGQVLKCLSKGFPILPVRLQ